MKLPLGIVTLFNLFTGAPNLCDDVFLGPTGAPYSDSIGQQLSRYCEWTGPTAPIWDAEVCCTIGSGGASCVEPTTGGRCLVGLRMYCEFGEVSSTGAVTCMQPFPDACDEGFCVQVPTPPPTQDLYWGCCSAGGACQLVTFNNAIDCPYGMYVSCDHGFQNQDGTVECY